MSSMLEKAVNVAESNIYEGISLSKSAIVISWTLLCLFLIQKSSDFLVAAASGAAYYISLIVLCLLLFKGISKYVCFPGVDKKIPAFLGPKLDTIFTYPVFLMALIGILGGLIARTGIFPAEAQGLYPASNTAALEYTVKVLHLPLIAFAEELFNLLMVSLTYKYLKPLGKFRLAISITAAALIFGFLHTFGWGADKAISVGISYLPVFFVTLYTGSIWISFFAHLYNDLVAITKVYYESGHYFIIIALAFIPSMWAVKSIFTKKY